MALLFGRTRASLMHIPDDRVVGARSHSFAERFLSLQTAPNRDMVCCTAQIYVSTHLDFVVKVCRPRTMTSMACQRPSRMMMSSVIVGVVQAVACYRQP